MKGFQNIGNTCYLNSGLQMLVQNKDLCQLIINNTCESEILNHIKNFILEYHQSDNGVLIPTTIKNIVGQRQDIFAGFGQQDSSEFIVCLLDIIQNELEKTKNTINTIYGIKFNIRIKCKLRSCLNIVDIKETNNFLILDLNPEIRSLESAYRNFKSCDKLNGENSYYCKNCKEKRYASKRTIIEEWPNNLFVWLKRFQQNGHQLTKNPQPLDIPLIWNHGMELQSAVIHYGSLNGGHYVCVGKKYDKWFLYDDSNVSLIKTEEELKQILSNAYWLCYKQCISK